MFIVLQKQIQNKINTYGGISMKLLWFKVRSDLFDKDLNATRIAIYTYLSMLSNRDGFCQVRHSKIAEKTNTSRRTVIRALDELQKLGFIQIINDGEGSNKYIVPANMDAVEVIDRRLAKEKREKEKIKPGNALTPEGKIDLYYNWLESN